MEQLWTWMRAEHGRVTLVASVCIQANGNPVTPSAIHQWKAIPPEYVIAIEELSGVSRHKLRPDVFGKAAAA